MTSFLKKSFDLAMLEETTFQGREFALECSRQEEFHFSLRYSFAHDMRPSFLALCKSQSRLGFSLLPSGHLWSCYKTIVLLLNSSRHKHQGSRPSFMRILNNSKNYYCFYFLVIFLFLTELVSNDVSPSHKLSPECTL